MLMIYVLLAGKSDKRMKEGHMAMNVMFCMVCRCVETRPICQVAVNEESIATTQKKNCHISNNSYMPM